MEDNKRKTAVYIQGYIKEDLTEVPEQFVGYSATPHLAKTRAINHAAVTDRQLSDYYTVEVFGNDIDGWDRIEGTEKYF